MTTEVLPPENEDILLVVFEMPQLALLDKSKADAFIAAVEHETKAVDGVDVATTKGQDEIRSMARKVTRSKTLLDKARLEMTADLRKQVADINEAGKSLVERLGALADQVRKPLTDWEAAEEARVKRIDKIMADLKAAMVVTIADTSDTVRERGEWAFNLEITREEFGKRYLDAKELRDLAVDALKEAMANLARQESERAELARLRQEAEEREARDRAEREAREARERQEREEREERESRERVAAEVERRRIEAEEAEARRIKEAEDRAADEAARRVAEVKNRELEEANRRAEEAERREREAREEREREEAAAQARENDKRHRAQIMGEIKIAIMAAGKITEQQATSILRVIAIGGIPRLKVEF